MTDRRSPPDEPVRDQVRPSRRIPPLVWIVLFLLVAWFAWAWVQRGGTDVTPHGATVPQQREAPAYMPAAPATPTAPATPAGPVNGPLQPAPPR